MYRMGVEALFWICFLHFSYFEGVILNDQDVAEIIQVPPFYSSIVMMKIGFWSMIAYLVYRLTRNSLEIICDLANNIYNGTQVPGSIQASISGLLIGISLHILLFDKIYCNDDDLK